MAGLGIIVLAIFISISAYFLAPDPTPYANHMVLEISGQRPGFKVTMLAMQKERPPARAGFFSRLLYGQESALTYVPIRSWQFAGNDIVVQRYVDEETSMPERYSLAKVWYGQEQPLRQPLAALQQQITQMMLSC